MLPFKINICFGKKTFFHFSCICYLSSTSLTLTKIMCIVFVLLLHSLNSNSYHVLFVLSSLVLFSPFRSFFIQNFTDTFRQCIIDLMQGQLNNANELKEDEVLSTILLILCPSVPAPTRGYFYAGVLEPEIKLLDNLLYTRWCCPSSA